MKKVIDAFKDYFCSRRFWKPGEIEYFEVNEKNDQSKLKKDCVTVFFGYTGYERLNFPCWDWVLHLQISGIILMARDLDKTKIHLAQNQVLEIISHLTGDEIALRGQAEIAGIIFKGGTIGALEDNHIFTLDFDVFVTDYEPYGELF